MCLIANELYLKEWDLIQVSDIAIDVIIELGLDGNMLCNRLSDQ